MCAGNGKLFRSFCLSVYTDAMMSRLCVTTQHRLLPLAISK